MCDYTNGFSRQSRLGDRSENFVLGANLLSGLTFESKNVDDNRGSGR